MKKSINVNSQEWCDMIFQEKNKSYGAYKLRQKSSKRHIWAFGFTILFAIAAAAIPTALSALDEYRAKNRPPDNIDITRVMSVIEEPKTPENEIKEQTTPPPPPLRPTVRFVPPTIAPDEEVDTNIEVLTQEELQSTRTQISIATIESENEEGVDIAELIERDRITEEAPPVFDIVEQMPSFPGGEAEMMRFIGENLRYPVVAQENGIQGRVVIRFVVTATGGVDDVQIMRGLDPSCDREAIRVVKSMPKWTAGRQNGKNVAVYFTLPILFRLR